MAELIPADVTSEGEFKEREKLGGNNTTEEKSSKRDTIVSHPQRETKKEPQKSYGRRRFHNTEYYRHDADNWSSEARPEGREKMRRFHHPHRGYWQSWNEDGHGERGTSRQYYHHDSYQSGDSQHHRRGGKRSGRKPADSSRVASTQDGAKEKRKKTTVQQSANSVTDESVEKMAKEKPDVDKSEVETEVNKTEEHSTVKVSGQSIDNSVIDEREEKVKRKPNVNSVEITEMEGRSTAELNNQTTDGSVTDKIGQKIFKKKPDIEVTKAKAKKHEKDPKTVEVHSQTTDNSVTYTKRRDKKVKKRTDIDKGELDQSTDKMATQSANNLQHGKDRKQNEPISDVDKENDMVIMIGKYQVKKFKPISTTNAAIAEDHTASGTSNSKVAPYKTADKTSSTNLHKKRVYHNKAMKGAGRHYGGVAASLQSDVLSQQLTTGQYECMVCCDRVRVKDHVWSCLTCYHVFHLKCIKKWAKIPTNLEEGW